jgi:hypothetical protein
MTDDQEPNLSEFESLNTGSTLNFNKIVAQKPQN